MYKEIYDMDVNGLFERELGIREFSGIVLDIGGFIGETAVYFAIMGTERVFVVELITHLYELLVRNIRLNSLKSVIIPLKRAIECRSGEIVSLKMPSLGDIYGFWDEAAILSYAGGEVIECVYTIGFSDLLRELGRLDLVKMN